MCRAPCPGPFSLPRVNLTFLSLLPLAMEVETLPSLSTLVEGADEWGDVLVLIPLLVALEVVLSADNAIALAAISRRLHDPERQRQALNLGLLLALLLRLALVFAARWVLRFWPLQLLAAGYLLWLSGSQLLPGWLAPSAPPAVEPPAERAAERLPEPLAGPPFSAAASPEAGAEAAAVPQPPAGDVPAGMPAPKVEPQLAAAAPQIQNLLAVVLTLGVTDLAFSLDSVAAAVAVTDRLPLVMAGGVIGVVALRLTAGLFIRWLEEFRHLETAGYLAVGLVGLRLVLRLAFPSLVVPEWAVLLSVGLLFAWGFRERTLPGEATSASGS